MSAPWTSAPIGGSGRWTARLRGGLLAGAGAVAIVAAAPSGARAEQANNDGTTADRDAACPATVNVPGHQGTEHGPPGHPGRVLGGCGPAHRNEGAHSAAAPGSGGSTVVMAGPAAPAVTIGVDADAPAVACDARRDVCWAPAAEDSGPAVWGAVVSQAPDETAQPHRGQGLVAAEPDGQPASVPGAMAIRSSPSAASAIGLLLLAVLAAAAVAVRRLHRVR